MMLINGLTMLCVRAFLVMALPNVMRFWWFRNEGTKGYLVMWKQNEYSSAFPFVSSCVVGINLYLLILHGTV